MSTYPLIHTKLKPPRLRDGYLRRPRLLEQLDRGLNADVILISAPAGYGKSTLAADWLNQLSLAHHQQPIFNFAWVSLDENDNHLDIFLRYVITALQEVFPQEKLCVNTQSLLDAAQPLPIEVIANNLVNNLAALPAPLILALDDYHLIDDPECQQVMARLVRYLPPMLRLLLISRVDPALPIPARLRGQQRITEIRAADLRFSPVEAHAVLERAAGTTVEFETAVALEAQTEGWIIGLQMAGISLRARADPAVFAQTVQDRGYRLIMDFLLDEVLAHQPRLIIDCLLQTSILERFCSPLCEAVVNLSNNSPLDGAGFLDLLDQTNLFLVPLDEQGEWYRYHHLFQELLRRRLMLEWDAEAIAGLHRRAGSWLADHGFTEEALHHFLAAGDAEMAVALVEANRHQALNREDFRTLERWLRMLPEARVASTPSLLQLKAWVLRLRFNLQAIPPLLHQVESLLAGESEASTSKEKPPSGVNNFDPANPDILLGERAALWSEIYFYQGDFQRSLASARSAMTRLPITCFFARSIAALYQCQSLQATGQMETAVALLNEMLVDQRLQHTAFKSRILIAAAAVYWSAGDLHNMEQVSRVLLKIGLAEHRPISIAWGHYCLGLVYYNWNRLDEARDHLSSVSEFRYQINFRAYHESMLELALVQQLLGETENSQQTLDSLSQVLLELNQNHFAAHVDAFRVRLAYLRGNIAEAMQLEQRITGSQYLPSWFWESSELFYLNMHIAQGNAAGLQKAAERIHTSLQATESSHQTEQLIELWALQALVEAAQDNIEAALAACQKAVQLAEPGGFIRLFVNLGAPMANLLRQLALRGTSVHFINRILAAFPEDQSITLTDREMVVMTCLQQGLSNQQIADKLIVSLHTVKKHNRNIFHKLGVHNRQQAITRAKALGLLP